MSLLPLFGHVNFISFIISLWCTYSAPISAKLTIGPTYMRNRPKTPHFVYQSFQWSHRIDQQRKSKILKTYSEYINKMLF